MSTPCHPVATPLIHHHATSTQNPSIWPPCPHHIPMSPHHMLQQSPATNPRIGPGHFVHPHANIAEECALVHAEGGHIGHLCAHTTCPHQSWPAHACTTKRPPFRAPSGNGISKRPPIIGHINPSIRGAVSWGCPDLLVYTGFAVVTWCTSKITVWQYIWGTGPKKWLGPDTGTQGDMPKLHTGMPVPGHAGNAGCWC